MKKTMTKLFFTAAFGLFASLAATAATGDIWSITRCNEFGVDQTGAATTVDNPFPAGEPLYFKIRLQARDLDSVPRGSRWYMNYFGVGSEIVAKALTPMQIGIYVSGRLDYATYETSYEEGDVCTAVIFKYVTKPGDFAMPIRLATATGPAGDKDSDIAYYFNPLRNFWDFSFDLRDSDGTVTNTINRCNWTFKTGGIYPESLSQGYDYSLEKCGFYVKTIDFSDDAEDPEFWRSIHEDSTITGGPSDPRLDADSGPEQTTTLYVWSEDESIVYIEGGTPTTMQLTSDPASTVTRLVGAVTFTGGQLSQKFQIRGVPGAQGKTANIVLSAYNHYNYSLATGDRCEDYLTTKVKCIEPMPTTIRIERDDATVIAPTAGDDQYLAAVTRLTVSATQAPKADVHVTINTVFQVDPTKTDWGNYVRFSTDNTVDTLPDPIAPVVTLTPTDYKKYIYVYALRAESACTIGTGKQVQFKPEVDPAEMVAAEVTALEQTGININANPPIITAPIGGDDPIYTVTAGEKLEIPVAVNDTYADMTDTTTGYKVRIKASGSSTAVTMPVNYTASGEGGLLESMDAAKASPSVTYPSTPGDVVTTVEVYSPIRKLWSAAATFKVTVTPAKTSAVEVTDDSDEYVEYVEDAEGGTVHYKVTLSDAPGSTVYAFLYNYEGAPAGTFGGTGAKAIITDDTVAAPGSQGILLTSVGTAKTGSFLVLDGTSEGATYTFGVVLCTSKSFNPANRVEGYPTTDLLNITVYNREPTFLQMYLNGFESDGDGATFANEYPKGQPQTIQPEFSDAAYDLTHGFVYKWTIKKDGKDVTNGIVRHDDATDAYDASSKTTPTIVPNGTSINVSSFQYSFPNAGVYEVRVQMRDKDMSRWAAEDRKFFVTIIDQPQVQIEVEDMYLEMAARDKIHVGLGYFPDSGETIIVKLTVTPPVGDNAGVLTLDSAYKAVPAGYPALADNEYYVPFTAAGMQDILIEAKDGTMLSSSKGFTITGEVMNDTPSIEPGVAWKDYYRPFSIKAYIENETPIFAGVTLENTNAWKVAGGAATSYPIRFQIKKDVDEDIAGIPSYPGIKVTIMGCDSGTIKPDLDSHPNPMEFYVTTDEPQSYVFTPNFGSMQGEQTVTLMIEDKDGGLQTWTYIYMIEPSKFLTTIQNGPTGTGNSPLSQKYVLRTGRGQGHIYVPHATFSDGARWRQNWNCSSATKIDVYGWGYRVGAVDNGWLNDRQDVALSITGAGIDSATAADVTDGFYPYPEAERDSYLYCWLIAAPQTEGGAPEWTLYIAPEMPLAEPEPATAYLPADLTGDQKSYIPVDVEGVFALEWLPADNCGDMNQDGVPDIFAMKSDWAAGNLIEVLGGDKLENDLLGLAATNPDEDLLPGIYRDANNSYAPIGIPFTTLLEIRGLDDGLNATDVTLSDISFSKFEQAAWEAFVAANNQALTDEDKDDTDPAWLDAANPDLTKWSPEPRSAKFPRMDPTTKDTDNDQFEDGWEYFFWYQAKVWVPGGEDKPLGKPRDGQHFVFERFNPFNIILGTEIPVDEVLARFDPCTPFDPEKYDGPKYLKFDFDYDGLSDLEEQLIGTNPCHWDTDGDRLCDAWEVMMCLDPLGGSKNDNPDGDYMAFRSVRHDMCWIDPADAATYAAELGYPNYGKGLPEDVRVYGLPGIRLGIDYDIDMGRYVMLKTMDVVSYSFNPKWLGGEQLTYGLRDDIPDIIPLDWVWGWYMVDNVRCETIHLNAGDEIFPDLEFVLVHDQVRDGFGFDPRTGWHANANGYVTDRWDPAHNPANVTILDQTGLAVNTRPYANYDEYLVMKYRADYGIDYSPNTKVDDPLDPDKETIWSFLQRKTTNPNNVYPVTTDDDAAEGEDGEAAANTNQTTSVAQQFANAAAAAGRPPVTTHGADTDQDGVPDGWELYMYRNPNSAPMPADEDGLGQPQRLDFDNDELSFVLEYAGTDSCEAYKDCASIYDHHPGNASGWFNKFFPTNPGTMKMNTENGTYNFAGRGNADGADTDLDGVVDSVEGGTWGAVFANGGRQWGVELGFIYGSPTDDGLTVCFRGGGMNPCTIDTDLDGLPDGWEMQHAGVPVRLPAKVVIEPRGAAAGALQGVELDAATFIADGINGDVDLPEVVYIAGGMDATWKGDAVFDNFDIPEESLSWDSLIAARRDVDFDHDGLQNYQEYLTQSVRHFRYDDITTPLMGRQLEEGTYDPFTSLVVVPHSQSFGDGAGGHDGTGTGYPVFDPADPATSAANAAEAWNGRSFVYYETITTGVREVIKVIDPYTGETSTNRIYYTAQKKMARPGATLVAQHVARGGSELQYAWTSDGWRDAGYFAPPRRDWDRAIASAKIESPLYMYPITYAKYSGMVGVNTSVAGYATTDPRISDTDGDGMDDFYEMYHGLNPLLGTTPANADATGWIGGKSGDIVSAQFYMAGYPVVDSRPTFNAWYNEWIYPRYSGLLGRNGMPPGDDVGAPIQAPQAYDPILYPWGMGTPMVDADGDGMRNDEERIVANVADPVARHTDPTPLWFTERTTPASYIAQYYVASGALAMPWGVATEDVFEDASLRHVTDTTQDIYFGGLISYQYSFEENEGYDTDGDMTPDQIEVVSTVRKSSDPLKFDDPSRNQALYLPGNNSYAISRDLQYRPIDSIDFLKQFTVECWVMPEKRGAAQTIVERTVAYEGDSINTDKIAIRANFRIGLDAQGKVYGMFDNNDSIESGLDSPRSCQFVDGGPLPLNEWSHIALTFDGSILIIYVNGVLKDSAPTQLIPANGVSLIYQNTGATNSFPAAQYHCDPSAFLIGARPKKQNLYALYPYFIENGAHMESFDNLQEYFKGYVDEVRVWDGARTGAQILENYRKAMRSAEASLNRDEVFESWFYGGGTRNNNDGNPTLPPELVLNYDFSTLPGAINEPDVAKTPAGFTKNVLYAAMSDYATNPDIDTTGLYPNLLDLKGLPDGGVEGDLLVGWWSECEVKSEVYTDYHVVPWIKNTVSHLPLLDGSAVDSFMYGDYFGSVYMSASDLGVAKLVFPNTSMPYPSTLFNVDKYYRLAHAAILVERRGESFSATLGKCRFQVRNNFAGTADLVPMGGAFAKTVKKMWNDNPSDPWEQTRDDTNGDGIPDWWEEYARHNYASDLDPAVAVSWDTLIDYHGVQLPAGKAYTIDIYRGMQPDGTFDPDYAVNTDDDGDNIPDWWENLFGVAEYGADDDPDNDGLSNYDEYLFSFGATPYGMENGFPFLDPARQRTGSGQKVTDYFLAGPTNMMVSADGSVTNILANQYLGEIATDHDFMEGWWEKTFSNSYANQYVYDPDRDTDGDGWDNFSENRAATWYGTILADTITRYLSDRVVLNNYPQPAIGLRFTYNGIQNVVGKSVVVRTMTKASGRTDATFRIAAPEAAEVGAADYAPGAFIDAKTALHGFLQPGNVLPQSCYVYGVHLSKAGVYYWGILQGAGSSSSGTVIGTRELTRTDGAAVACLYCKGTFADYDSDVRAYGRENVILDNPSLEFEQIGKAVSRDDGRIGDIVIMNAQTTLQSVFGSINFVTGEFTLDPAPLDTAGLAPDGMLVRVSYNYEISAEWPQTLWLNQPTVGRVKQGLNMIEAWMDLNGDGAYTAGEPYGVVRNVNVGWHKTNEAVIELKDTSGIIPHYLLSDGSSDRAVVEGVSGGVSAAEGAAEGDGGGLAAKIAVRRVSINGQREFGQKNVPARKLISKAYILDDRAYITEADVLTDDKFDLDWKWLVSDAEKLGLAASDINTAEYEIDRVNTLADGSVTNVAIATFVNRFNRQRPVPVARAPLADLPVYTAAPTFSWSCSDDTMTAFRLQVSTSTNAADVVYDSGVRQLPGLDSLAVGVLGYSFTAPIYVGAPVATNGAPVLLDGSNYFWRVTEFNAKFNAEDAKSWSAWAQFQMDVANENVNPRLPTGYGKCGAVVRYFGPNTNDLEGLVVVEAHQTADFAGQPLAQTRADVSQLADRDDLKTTNAEFAGIDPGTVYLMAYIDANNNGRRDVNESWGYANYVGTEALSLFTPQGLEVTDEILRRPSIVIYIEDTDFDRNEILDCLEAEAAAGGAAGDSDRDGLLDDEEPSFATDPAVWDTDGDGMPDGWEVKFADLDPNFDDAEEAADGDVMAFALKDCTIVTVLDTNGVDKASYILKDGQKTPTVGDPITGYSLYTIYDYPVVENGVRNSYYGRGKEFFADDTMSNRVIAVTSGKVVLVHAQVNDEFGFNAKTANPSIPEEDRVNTKTFTALDKYLVVRYLEALGVVDPAMAAGDTLEDWVNVNRKWADYTLMANIADGDWVDGKNNHYGDGVPDGWELYVGKDPWNFADRESDDDGDGLPLYREFDAGNVPTDPWNIDTDDDGVFDIYAWKYHLKGDQAGEDPDGDGLSNYAEYLISEVFQIVKLDPDKAMTDDSTLDYYRKFGELYFGEIFTDHDRIDDEWEAQYEFGNIDGYDYASRGIYDPDADLDHDGWSNYAEYRAGTSPASKMSTGIDDYTLIDHPVPVVEMEVVYNGAADIEGSTLTVKAWNEELDPDALSAPIAKWTVATLNEGGEGGTTTQQAGETNEDIKEKYIGRMPTGKRTYYLGGGAVKEGSFKLLIKDKNWVEGQAISIGGQNYFEPTSLGDPDAALWFYDVIDQNGKLMTRGGIFAEAHSVGTIDYNSGRITIDFDDEEFTREILVGDPSDSESGSGNNNGNNGNTYHGLHPADSYVKFSWSPVSAVPVTGIHFLGDTTSGLLRAGPTTFIVEVETSAAAEGNGGNNGGNSEGGQDSTAFNNKRLYGVVRHVDVGWAGAKFKVELTDFSPITPRIDLWSGDFDRAEPLVISDPRINILSNALESVAAQGSRVRVRVVRYAINGYPIVATWGSGLADVVYDKVFSSDCDRLFCELDFMLDGKFDVDWTESFTAKVANLNGDAYETGGEAGNIQQVLGDGESITNMQYMVVIGDGDVTWERPESTNVVNALPHLITRRFDHTRATAVVGDVAGIQYSAKPTFRWHMKGEEPAVKRYGSSYTAFRLQVRKSNVIVYDSGPQSAPEVDVNGNFCWTAPVCAGSMFASGQEYSTAGSYTWQVSMYNARFRADDWSKPAGTFTTAVNAQQEVNDHGYSSIAVAVKYAGPSIVLKRYADMSRKTGKVIVQAFGKPDFSGVPLAQGMATNDVDELALAEANAWLKGLPAIGTYYVRAFVDMDGDGKLAEWEPWGYVADEVTLVNDGTLVKAPLVSVWIEDSDSDGDWVPDAYEYAANGWENVLWESLKGNKRTTANRQTAVLPDGGIVLTLPSLDELTGAGISSGLPGASLTTMQSPEFVAAVMGITNDTYQTTLEAIAEATRGKLVPKSVRVVAITLEQDQNSSNAKKVNITVGADVASGIAGSFVANYYTFVGSDTATVKVKVLKKNSLEDAVWTLSTVTSEPITLRADTPETVSVQLDNELDLKSGFFKIELEEVP